MYTLDNALSIGLAVTIVAALGCLGYVVANPRQGERFTEFYVLGSDGMAQNYTEQVIIGEEAQVILGIVNHALEPISYRVEIDINGIKDKEILTGIMSPDEKWEQVIGFTPDKIGPNQKVEFWLYKDGETQPYLKYPLHFYIDVE